MFPFASAGIKYFSHLYIYSPLRPYFRPRSSINFFPGKSRECNNFGRNKIPRFARKVPRWCCKFQSFPDEIRGRKLREIGCRWSLLRAEKGSEEERASQHLPQAFFPPFESVVNTQFGSAHAPPFPGPRKNTKRRAPSKKWAWRHPPNGKEEPIQNFFFSWHDPKKSSFFRLVGMQWMQGPNRGVLCSSFGQRRARVKSDWTSPNSPFPFSPIPERRSDLANSGTKHADSKKFRNLLCFFNKKPCEGNEIEVVVRSLFGLWNLGRRQQIVCTMKRGRWWVERGGGRSEREERWEMEFVVGFRERREKEEGGEGGGRGFKCRMGWGTTYNVLYTTGMCKTRIEDSPTTNCCGHCMASTIWEKPSCASFHFWTAVRRWDMGDTFAPKPSECVG